MSSVLECRLTREGKARGYVHRCGRLADTTFTVGYRYFPHFPSHWDVTLLPSQAPYFFKNPLITHTKI